MKCPRSLICHKKLRLVRRGTGAVRWSFARPTRVLLQVRAESMVPNFITTCQKICQAMQGQVVRVARSRHQEDRRVLSRRFCSLRSTFSYWICAEIMHLLISWIHPSGDSDAGHHHAQNGQERRTRSCCISRRSCRPSGGRLLQSSGAHQTNAWRDTKSCWPKQCMGTTTIQRRIHGSYAPAK